MAKGKRRKAIRTAPRRFQRDMKRRAPELERRAFAKFGSKVGWGFRVSRVLPIMLGISIGLWAFAPAAWMRAITPWAGAAALVCAGVYLTRVVARIGHFSNEYAARFGGHDSGAIKRLKSALYKMASVLVGTIIVAGGFFYLSATVLRTSTNPGEPGLLWSLTLGGLVLAIFFGEAVTRLIELLEEAMEQLAEQQARHAQQAEQAPEDAQL